jgi:hypothetical protein
MQANPGNKSQEDKLLEERLIKVRNWIEAARILKEMEI